MRYRYQSSDEFRGILFNQKSSYNITSSGENSNEARYQYLVDNKPSTYSCTRSQLDSFYEFSFKYDKKVIIENYMLRAYNSKSMSCFPKAFVLSGFTGKEWINVSRVEESELTEYNKTAVFRTERKIPFLKIRISQTGSPHCVFDQYYNFCMADFELFGMIGRFITIQRDKSHTKSHILLLYPKS